MNLSKKSRYGLTALIDLSIHSTKGHVSLISIAETEFHHSIWNIFLPH